MANDGGPAFPVHQPAVTMNLHGDMVRNYNSDAKGISLRDYFAAAALTGLTHSINWDSARPTNEPEEITARYAYSLADAMLAERDGPSSRGDGSCYAIAAALTAKGQSHA